MDADSRQRIYSSYIEAASLLTPSRAAFRQTSPSCTAPLAWRNGGWLLAADDVGASI